MEVDAVLAQRSLASLFLCSALASAGEGGDVAEAIAGLECTVR